MIKIGITGGIGSGKSVVAELFRIMGIPVYIADIESKLLTETSPVIRKKLCELFGTSIYGEKGLDKKKLASYIFNDPALLQKVNHIIHPEVSRHFIDWVSQQKGSICVIESAILFESGFDSLVDKTITVFAPRSLRIQRASVRDKITQTEIEQRSKNQLDDDIKRKRSTFTIYNDDRTAIIPQVQELLKPLTHHPFPSEF